MVDGRANALPGGLNHGHIDFDGGIFIHLLTPARDLGICSTKTLPAPSIYPGSCQNSDLSIPTIGGNRVRCGASKERSAVDQPVASSQARPAVEEGGEGSRAAAAAARAAQAAQDRQTLSLLKRGHTAAMEDLLLRYQDRLFNTILRIVGHPEDAADLVQETFVSAIQHLGSFQGNSTVYTWLYRIAVNRSLTHRRAARYRKTSPLDGNRATSGDDQADGLRLQLSQSKEHDPAADAEMRMDHELLLGALGALEPEMRAIIVLRDIDECDYEQIGEILELPLGTVKSRLFRARAALRERCIHRPAPTNAPTPRPREGETR